MAIEIVLNNTLYATLVVFGMAFLIFHLIFHFHLSKMLESELEGINETLEAINAKINKIIK